MMEFGVVKMLPRWRKVISLVIISLVLPTLCDKVHHQANNSSNSIDRRKTDVYEDEANQFSIGCGSCKMREELKNRNLEVIKTDMLRKMGFQSAPNVTGRVLPQVPKHIMDKLDLGAYLGMQSDEPQFKTGPSVSEEEDDFHVKTETVLTFAQPYPRLRHSWRGHEVIHFQFSDSITKYHVNNATLFVYVKGVERRPMPTFHLEIIKVFKNPDNPDVPGMRKMSNRKMSQPLGRGDWVEVDITTMVSEWFKNPRENLGFMINGSVNGKKVVFTDVSSDKPGTKVPYVEITTREAKRRTRRNLGLNCDEKMNESLCCRYPLTVDFEEFGWDFIIAPKRYEAHYCSGDCPYITLQKHPHTHLLQMASPNIANPCCAPRKMSAISMLYFDQLMNVVYGSLPGMVVDRCGCA